MYCPECKAEYRRGFTRCADCDVELVENYVEAVRHPIAKKVAVGDEYDVRLWHGTEPHFYVGLLGSLWNKKVACYGVPEHPPVPKSETSSQFGTWGLAEFEVWVSEENLPLAKWILESGEEEFGNKPPEARTAGGKETEDDVSPETTGICPLCFGEFTSAISHCPNCGVPLHSPLAEVAAEETAWELCNLSHPKFITELRKALQTVGIPFNNANISYGDLITGWYYMRSSQVLVLKKDFERATQVMSQVLQRWEFEPSAGFGFRNLGDPLADYWPERATQIGWMPEDISVLLWSGENIGPVGGIGLALQEHEIPYRVDTEQLGTAKIFVHPEDEAQARGLLQEVLEGPRPD